VHGQVQIVNATFATGSMPLGLQNGNGVLTLTQDRLDITSFQAMIGGGQVTARGGIVYRPSLQFDMALSGRGVRMLYPDTVRETFGTDLVLTGTPDAAQLRGDVRIYQISFTPDFDLMQFIGQFSGEVTPPPTQGFSQNLTLDVNVTSTGGVNVQSRELSLQGTANLHVQGTASEPVILGRINVTGGDLIFLSNRYVLQTGTIDFANPVQTTPVVNVTADTTVQQYNVHLHFTGPLDHLRTAYTSDPALPPADIINLLAFGKTTEAAAANPTPGTLGAESTIASQVSSQVTSKITKIAGISQLSVDPVLGTTSGQNPGARVTIQQRVTGNLFVTFSTDITSTQREVIEGQYNFSPRTSFTVSRDQNGGFGFDTRFRKTW
jgi:translocation and assembly module TamB